MPNPTAIFSLALWLSGIGHFCVLGASFQVPARLHWKEELARLAPFNRKLMWVHGAFAVVTIIAFGLLTLLLHDDMLHGDRAALALAAFIGTYWALRVLVDVFYYDHADWPQGPAFRIGHALLTALFVCLACTNLGLLAWQLYFN
jgi:hypothetical protein